MFRQGSVTLSVIILEDREGNLLPTACISHLVRGDSSVEDVRKSVLKDYRGYKCLYFHVWDATESVQQIFSDMIGLSL